MENWNKVWNGLKLPNLLQNLLKVLRFVSKMYLLSSDPSRVSSVVLKLLILEEDKMKVQHLAGRILIRKFDRLIQGCTMKWHFVALCPVHTKFIYIVVINPWSIWSNQKIKNKKITDLNWNQRFEKHNLNPLAVLCIDVDSFRVQTCWFLSKFFPFAVNFLISWAVFVCCCLELTALTGSTGRLTDIQQLFTSACH